METRRVTLKKSLPLYLMTALLVLGAVYGVAASLNSLLPQTINNNSNQENVRWSRAVERSRTLTPFPEWLDMFPDENFRRTILCSVYGFTEIETGPNCYQIFEEDLTVFARVTELGNNLTVPIMSMEGIQYFLSLETLRLGPESPFTFNVTHVWPRGGIQELDLLSGLTRLTYLNLSCQRISDLSPLRNLTRLSELILNNNEIEDISVLGNLFNLRTLCLSLNKITDPSSLTKLYYLNNLQITLDNPNNFGFLANMSRLRMLTVYESNITNLNVLPLASLKDLTFLNLSGNPITNFSLLSSFASLTTLVLNNCQIEDLSTLPLNYLGVLSFLSLNDNNISDLSRFSGKFALTSLSLARNQIEDITPLSMLHSLTQLILSSNRIENIKPIQGLTSLNNLNLSENRIVDITSLLNLKKLSSLFIQNNLITDVSVLSNLSQLNVVNFSGNQVAFALLENVQSVYGNNQNIKVSCVQENGVFYVDLKTIVGAENIAHIRQTTVNFIVTQIDADGRVNCGTRAPTDFAYTFETGVDGSSSVRVVADLTITAQVFTVRFVDWDDTLLQTKTVGYGEAVVASIHPVRDGYIFIGWEASSQSIVSDTTFKAVYREISNSGSDNSNNVPQSSSSNNNLLMWVLVGAILGGLVGVAILVIRQKK